MRQRNLARLFALVVCALVAGQWVITAQSKAQPQAPSKAQRQAASKPQPQAAALAPATPKRPLTYDVIDSWRSIQGTRLSSDGQWLAYATTSQAEDGELVVRNLKTGQQFTYGRGTGPVFTEDGAFVVFTIAQSKADEEKDRQSQGSRGAQSEEGGTQAARGETPAAATPREPKTGLGIMALPSGQVTPLEKVGSFRVADESSHVLAAYKGVGGAGGGGRGGARERAAAPARARRHRRRARRQRSARAAAARARSARTPVPTSFSASSRPAKR